MQYILFLILFIPTISSAGDIYKCTDSAGNAVYSQRPCSPQAEKIEVKINEPEVSHQSSDVAKSARKEKIAGLDRQQTIDKAVRRLDKQRRRQLKDIDKQIDQVNYQKSLSMNNYAGATRDIGLNEQLAQLKSSRIDVELRYQQLINDARYPD